MTQTLIKVFGALGGGAVVFYVLGFTVVQTYIYKIGLEGMFWFTNEYYGDAGAKFLLEMVRAPLLAPHVFLPYFILLFLMLPKEKNLQVSPSGKAILSSKQWVKLSFLLLLMIGTYLLALYYGKLLKIKPFLTLIDYLFLNPTGNPFAQAEQSLAFFSLVTPMVIAFALLLYRFRGVLKPDSKSRIVYQIALMVYLVFLTIIPIAYGFYIYDWKMVPIKEPQIIKHIASEEKSDASSTRIWLLGQFGGKYFFFKKEGIKATGVVEVFNEDQIKYLNFDLKRADSLREQMEESYVDLSLNEVENILNQSLE